MRFQLQIPKYRIDVLRRTGKVAYILDSLRRARRSLLTEVPTHAACIVQHRDLAITLLIVIKPQLILLLQPREDVYIGHTKLSS